MVSSSVTAVGAAITAASVRSEMRLRPAGREAKSKIMGSTITMSAMLSRTVASFSRERSVSTVSTVKPPCSSSMEVMPRAMIRDGVMSSIFFFVTDIFLPVC